MIVINFNIPLLSTAADFPKILDFYTNDNESYLVTLSR